MANLAGSLCSGVRRRVHLTKSNRRAYTDRRAKRAGTPIAQHHNRKGPVTAQPAGAIGNWPCRHRRYNSAPTTQSDTTGGQNDPAVRGETQQAPAVERRIALAKHYYRGSKRPSRSRGNSAGAGGKAARPPHTPPSRCSTTGGQNDLAVRGETQQALVQRQQPCAKV
jgi:hypothetical protein